MKIEIINKKKVGGNVNNWNEKHIAKHPLSQN